MKTNDAVMSASCRQLKLDKSIASLDRCCAGKTVEMLNDTCFCVSLDQAALRQALANETDDDGLFHLLEERCPYVFAARPVFISSEHVQQMQALVKAIESVVSLPGYREAALVDAPAVARHSPRGAKSVFFGYDFHVHEEGVALIEINTNAGGAMLNAILARAQRACCAPVKNSLPVLDGDAFEKAVVDMFRTEWKVSGAPLPLKTVAIVDETPAAQYLYPEFLLFQRLFKRHGIEAIVAGPEQLAFREGRLWHGQTPIDLVYNRLTDFMLEAPASAALRDAYLADAVVLTPHPQAHALYANKRNLALLTDPKTLSGLGVPAGTQNILLAGIPKTWIVSAADAERLWSERRHLFFKPVAGYGSRAAYRGDKVTKRVWEEILTGAYVAQAIAAPSSRMIDGASEIQAMKFDVRAYAYDGEVQWLAARLYQGQTTNFRTPGGGFAPVYQLET